MIGTPFEKNGTIEQLAINIEIEIQEHFTL